MIIVKNSQYHVLQMFGECDNIDIAEQLWHYLVRNANSFSLLVEKKYSYLMRDENGNLIEVYANTKQQEITLECKDDPILLDYVFSMPIKWIINNFLDI